MTPCCIDPREIIHPFDFSTPTSILGNITMIIAIVVSVYAIYVFARYT